MSTQASGEYHATPPTLVDGETASLQLDASGNLKTSNSLLPAALGPATAATSLSVVPAKEQNPIFDTANGVKTAVTTSTTILTVPAGCQFVRIVTDVSIMVNTGGTAAADTSTGGVMILANQPEMIPVTPGEVLKGLSLGGSATVRCVPMKNR